MKMRNVIVVLLGMFILKLQVATAVNSVDYYIWESTEKPYTAYYLEDYCTKKACDEDNTANTFFLNATGPNSGAVIKSFRDRQHNVDETKGRKLECCVVIKTEMHRQIFIEMEQLDMEDRNGDCDRNYILMTNVSDKPGRMCNGQVKAKTFTTFTNFVSIRMVVHTGTDDWRQQNAKFVLTSVFTPSRQESCDAHETFMCDNGRCIWQGFQCDGKNNCGDRSDEFFCDFWSLHWQSVVWFSLGAIALLTVIGVCCCCWCRPRREYIYVQGGFGKTGPNRVERYGANSRCNPPSYEHTPPPPYNENYHNPSQKQRLLPQ